VVRRFAAAAGLDDGDAGTLDSLVAPLRSLRSSQFFEERVVAADSSRAEVPLLLELDGTLLRGSIDLLVEDSSRPPMIVDYKTDRLGDDGPVEAAERYATQRAIYAVAVAEARGVEDLDVAYVFLERPEEPVVTHLDRTSLASARLGLQKRIDAMGGAEPDGLRGGGLPPS
jgi:ATP-dependent exoDNAse (exonuclease V) beta subunit